MWIEVFRIEWGNEGMEMFYFFSETFTSLGVIMLGIRDTLKVFCAGEYLRNVIFYNWRNGIIDNLGCRFSKESLLLSNYVISYTFFRSKLLSCYHIWGLWRQGLNILSLLYLKELFRIWHQSRTKNIIIGTLNLRNTMGKNRYEK